MIDPGPGLPPRSVLVDDGDELRFCSTCAFSAAYLERGYHKSRLRELHVLVEHSPPFREGERVFREGDDFKRGRSRQARLTCFVGALVVYGAMLAIARTHDPLGPLRMLLA